MISGGAKVEYIGKIYSLLALIAGDVVLNTLMDFQEHELVVLSMGLLQLVARVAGFFILFLLMTRTFVFQYGLIATICQKLTIVFILFPVTFIFMIVLRLFLIIRSFEEDDILDIWDSSYYHTLYCIHNILSVVYYAIMLRASFHMSDESLYRPSAWLNR